MPYLILSKQLNEQIKTMPPITCVGVTKSHTAHWSPSNGVKTPDMMCTAEIVWCILPFHWLILCWIQFSFYKFFTLHASHLYKSILSALSLYAILVICCECKILLLCTNSKTLFYVLILKQLLCSLFVKTSVCFPCTKSSFILAIFCLCLPLALLKLLKEPLHH